MTQQGVTGSIDTGDMLICRIECKLNKRRARKALCEVGAVNPLVGQPQVHTKYVVDYKKQFETQYAVFEHRAILPGLRQGYSPAGTHTHRGRESFAKYTAKNKEPAKQLLLGQRVTVRHVVTLSVRM
jgi:hypothetical protein